MHVYTILQFSQLAEWSVHKDVHNKTVRSRVQSPMMPVVPSLCSPRSCSLRTERAVTRELRILDKGRLGSKVLQKPMIEFFPPFLEHFSPLFIQTGSHFAQIDTYFAQNTISNPFSLLSRHPPFRVYVHTQNPPSAQIAKWYLH